MGLAYVFDIEKLTLEHYPVMEIGRKNHAMAWIDGRPAVLGGEDSRRKTIKGVEVLEFNRWVKKPSMIEKRSGHTACTTQKLTFVVGGNNSRTVEVFDNKVWSMLNIEFPSPRSYPAIFNNGNLIFFVGNNGGIAYYNYSLMQSQHCPIDDNWDMDCSHSTIRYGGSAYKIFGVDCEEQLKYSVVF